MANKRAIFCTINFTKKRECGLTLNEYVLLDTTFHLSSKTGWCYASKDYLSDVLDISRQSIFNIINKLIKENWLEKDSGTKFIRTTEKWHNIYYETENGKQTNESNKAQSKNFTDSKESLLHSKESLLPTVKKVYSDSKETLPNSYIITTVDNHINLEDIICSEPLQVSEPEVIKFPTNRFNTINEEYSVTENYFNEMKTCYPAVDVNSELNKMRAWLISNSEKRKTKQGMPKFINSWLSKAQDKGLQNGSTTNSGHTTANKHRTLAGGRVAANFKPEDYQGGWDG